MTSDPKNLSVLPKFICSPALESGRTPCDGPDLATTGLSGQAAAHASLSARQAEQAGLLTSGTYGPTGIGLSRSAALQLSLANKLRARTASAGSILYRLTWKERVTPSGRPICALRASAWSGKSPKAANGYAGPFTIVSIPSFDPCFAILPIGLAREISTRAETIFASDSILSGWPTTTAGDAASTGNLTANRKSDAPFNSGVTMTDAATLSGWPTPCQQDGPNGGPAQGAGGLPGCAPLVGWKTPNCPRSHDSDQSAGRVYPSKKQQDLPEDAWLTDWNCPDDRIPGCFANKPLSGWPTTSVSNDRSARPVVMTREDGTKNQQRLQDFAAISGPMRLTADGTLKTGCSAGMESGGQLDPAHSRWLMELPPGWDDCAPMVTRSTRKRRPDSAKP